MTVDCFIVNWLLTATSAMNNRCIASELLRVCHFFLKLLISNGQRHVAASIINLIHDR